MAYNQQEFLADLDTFIRLKTCVDQNPRHFAEARSWIADFFDSTTTEIIEQSYSGFTNLIIKPRESQ